MSNFLFITTLLQLKFYAALFLVVLCSLIVIERLRDIVKIIGKNNAENQSEKKGVEESNEVWWNLLSIILGLSLLKYMGDYILSVIQNAK